MRRSTASRSCPTGRLLTQAAAAASRMVSPMSAHRRSPVSQHVDHNAHPRLIGIGVEHKARGQVFERAGDVGSVGDRCHEEASTG
jgi:hypothetical protein